MEAASAPPGPPLYAGGASVQRGTAQAPPGRPGLGRRSTGNARRSPEPKSQSLAHKHEGESYKQATQLTPRHLPPTAYEPNPSRLLCGF